MKRIALHGPLAVLIVFGLLYQPYFTSLLPASGWNKVLLSPQVFFLVSSGILGWVLHLRLSDIGLKRGGAPRQIFFGLLLGLAPALLVLVLAFLLTLADHAFPFLPRPIFGGEGRADPISADRWVTLLLLAPLSEEIFFRGLLLPSLRQNYPAWAAVVVSSLIFMAAHGGSGPVSFLPFLIPGPLMLGLIAGPIALRTRSIVAPIVFHSISNAYGPLLLFCFPNLYRYIDFLFQ